MKAQQWNDCRISGTSSRHLDGVDLAVDGPFSDMTYRWVATERESGLKSLGFCKSRQSAKREATMCAYRKG